MITRKIKIKVSQSIIKIIVSDLRVKPEGRLHEDAMKCYSSQHKINSKQKPAIEI